MIMNEKIIFHKLKKYSFFSIDTNRMTSCLSCSDSLLNFLYKPLIDDSIVQNKFDDIKMVVWDFDNTITRYHTSVGDIIYNVNDVVKDNELFVKTIDLLLDKKKQIAIASYGYKSVILLVMKSVFGHRNPFNEYNVITPQDIDSRWKEGYYPPLGFNKNNMLNLLAVRYQYQPNDIVLLDDSSQNIVNAKQSKFSTMHLPNGYHRYISNDLNIITNENIITFFDKAIC